MSDDEPQISILDARLAEIDRRLRTIQTGLAEDAGGPAEGTTPTGESVRPAEDAAPTDSSRGGPSTRIAVPEPVSPSYPASPTAPAARPVSLAPAPPPPPADDSADEPPGLVVAELRGLVAEHARLLDAMSELLASGERILARAAETAIQRTAVASPAVGSPAGVPGAAAPSLAPAPAPPAAAPGAAAAAPGAVTAAPVTVTAGPFSSIDAVRGFERALGTLPGVVAVQVRGYEGGDRAVVDVHLSGPTP